MTWRHGLTLGGCRGTARRTLEFVHFGPTAKYQWATALARLRESGDPSADGWVRDLLIWQEENNPSPPALPYPLPRRGPLSIAAPAGNPNVETPGYGLPYPLRMGDADLAGTASRTPTTRLSTRA